MDNLCMEWTLPATANVLYEHFTNADLLRQWYWPPSFRTEVSLDVVVGGAWRIASGVAGIAVSGKYSATVPGERLAFSWQWQGEDFITHVSIRFEPEGRLVLEHSGFVDAETRQMHEQGWRDCVNRLAGLLTGD